MVNLLMQVVLIERGSLLGILEDFLRTMVEGPSPSLRAQAGVYIRWKVSSGYLVP